MDCRRPFVLRNILAATMILSSGLIHNIGLAEENSLQEKALRRYSHGRLMSFWQDTLKPESEPVRSWYQDAFNHMSGVQESNKGNSQNRLSTIWGSNTKDSAAHPFYVYAIPSASAASIFSREIGLRMFLNRLSFYEEEKLNRDENSRKPLFRRLLDHKKKVKEQNKELKIAENSAYLELFLIKMARYREANSLEGKCQNITDADLYAKSLNQNLVLDRNFETLKVIYKEVFEYFSNELEKKTVCTYRSTSSKAQFISKMKQSINSKIVKTMKDEKTKTVDPINTILGKFDDYLERIKSVDPKTSSLLNLERKLNDAATNVQFVARDELKFEDNINKKIANDVDLDSISALSPNTTLTEHDNVYNARQSLVEATKTFLRELSGLGNVVSDQGDKLKFQKCENLLKKFEALLPQVPSNGDDPSKPFSGMAPTTKSTFINNYNACINAIDGYVKDKLQDNDPNSELTEIFSKHLKNLSTVMFDL